MGFVGDAASGLANLRKMAVDPLDIVGKASGALDSIHNKSSANTTNLQQSDYQRAINQGQQSASELAAHNADLNTTNAAANATGNRQSQLADALLAQSQGKGPANDLAQAQLQAATNRNQQMAAGQAGSLRGMNPALAQRLILQNQANVGQQAANQSAQNVAQASLGAQSQLGGALSAQRSQDIGQQQTNIGAQQAQTQLLGTAGGLQNQQNATNVQNQLGAAGINAGIAGQNAAANQAMISGVIGGAGAALGKAAHGGRVGYYALGGEAGSMPAANDWASFMGADKAKNAVADPNPMDSSMVPTPGVATSADWADAMGANQAKETAVPANSSGLAGALGGFGTGFSNGMSSSPASFAPISAPGVPNYLQNYTPPKSGGGGGGAAGLAKIAAMAAKSGGQVPGEPKVPGDSYTNDTVKAVLSPGEIVIPNSITESPDAPEKARDFVANIKSEGHKGDITERNPMPMKDHQDKVLDFIDAIKTAKEPKKSAVPAKEGYSKVLHAHKQLDARLKKLEEMLAS